MKTFTHEQVQEILRSAGEAPNYDREGLADHLSGCAECRSYAALVTELGQVVPGMLPVAPAAAQDIRRKILAAQPRLRRQTTLVRVSRGARTALWVGASLMLVLFLVLLFPRLLPRQAGGNPTPTLTPPSTATAATTPTTDAGGLELSALLKIFPLAPGVSWSYTKEFYSQDGSDPSTLLHAVTGIDERVLEVSNQPPDYFAHVQRHTSLVSADSGWNNTEGLGLGSYDFWYVVRGGRVYLSHERPDPANLALDQLSEELDFPLTVGSSWCPNKIQKGSLTPEAETPVPCASAGARTVLAKESYTTQAGKFEPCYQMSDFYNSGSPIRVFCEGVGFVAETYDHGGTRFGYSQELFQFFAPAAMATPTALQISQQAVWGKGAISAAEYSPDGKRLGVVTTQGIYIYDAASLAQLDFIPNAAAFPAVAFSPDWSLLAVGNGSSVSLLRLADRAEIAPLETDQGKVTRLLFSPDGRYLAGLVQPPGEEVYTKVLELWSVADGKLLDTWQAGVNPQLAFTPDSQSLYVWYPDTMVGTQHWQIPSGKALPVLNDFFPRPVVFSPDGNLDVAVGSLSDLTPMRIRSIADGARLPTFIWEQAGFSGSLFTTSDGALLVGLGSDGLGKVWRTKDGTVLNMLNASVAKGQVMAISPDGQTIVVSAADGLVFYNLSTGKISQRLQSHPQSIRQAVLSPQGDRVAALIGDSDPEKISLAVWSYPQEQPIYLLPRIAAVAALDLAWSPAGDRLVLASWDGRVLILNASDGTLVQTLPGHPQQVQSVAWSPDGTQIASSSFSVKLWRVSDGTLLADLSGSGQWITGLVFSPDGVLLAGADAAGKIDLWDLKTKMRVAQLPVTVSSDARGMAFTPDGKTLVAGEGADLWFYRLADFQLFLHVQGQNGAQVISLAVAPDGTWLACGLADGTVQLRALPGGELLQTLDGGGTAISSLDFSSDSTTLLSASRDGTLHFYNIHK